MPIQSGPHTAKQYTEGKPAFQFDANGKESEIYVGDSGGRSGVRLYCEQLTLEQENGGVSARLYCPVCGDALLKDIGIIGPNNKQGATCPVCHVKFHTRDGMAPGVGLEM